MTKKDPFIRYEINRKIKAVLIRHAVDITEMQYSNTGKVVYLFGKLVKDPTGDFKAAEVEALIREIAAIPEVQDISFELSNWTVMYEPGFVDIREKG
ncbi:MAG: hypothetical protein PVG78_07985 [Desulfobacterales bacterium]|jgi:hypothetical protein